MGMFDWVKFEMVCPVCGKKVDGFQSKDRECIMAEIDPFLVNNFYSVCDSCDAWIKFDRKTIPELEKLNQVPRRSLNEVLELFEMAVEKPSAKKSLRGEKK